MFTGEPTLVEFVRIEFLCPERPAGPIKLDFKEVKTHKLLTLFIVEESRDVHDLAVCLKAKVNSADASYIQGA